MGQPGLTTSFFLAEECTKCLFFLLQRERRRGKMTALLLANCGRKQLYIPSTTIISFSFYALHPPSPPPNHIPLGPRHCPNNDHIRFLQRKLCVVIFRLIEISISCVVQGTSLLFLQSGINIPRVTRIAHPSKRSERERERERKRSFSAGISEAASMFAIPFA